MIPGHVLVVVFGLVESEGECCDGDINTSPRIPVQKQGVNIRSILLGMKYALTVTRDESVMAYLPVGGI